MTSKGISNEEIVDVLKIQNIRVKITHKFMDKNRLLDIYFKLVSDDLKDNIPIDM